jgi:hypothetical protein
MIPNKKGVIFLMNKLYILKTLIIFIVLYDLIQILLQQIQCF